jgi:hypothetical protein
MCGDHQHSDRPRRGLVAALTEAGRVFLNRFHEEVGVPSPYHQTGCTLKVTHESSSHLPPMTPDPALDQQRADDHRRAEETVRSLTCPCRKR